MPSEQEMLHNIEQNARKLGEASANIQKWYGVFLNQAEKDFQNLVADGKNSQLETKKILEVEYNEATENTINKIQSINIEIGDIGLSWLDPFWETYQASQTDFVPKLTMLGTLVERNIWSELRVPALIPFIGSGNLLLEAYGGAKDLAVEGLQAFMLQLLATMPPGKVQFLLLDPVGLGQNVAGFMRLDKYLEELVGPRAWTEPNHIEQRLADVTEHMENVIQKYLRNQYEDMETYNLEAGEVAEPYRIVVAVNFPVNFSESASRRLVSIAANGARCGVHVLATVDMNQPIPYGFNLAELERHSHVIRWQGEHFKWLDPVFQGCELELESLPDDEVFDKILSSVGEKAKQSSVVQVPFTKLFTDDLEWWQQKSDDLIVASVGRAGASKIQQFSIGKGTAQHALIAGKTGSGKSNLLHVLIISLAINYSPEELQLYLIDFKKGVEFKDYASRSLPHARVIAIESEREFGLSVLQGLDQELKIRGERFREVGVNSISEFRKSTNQILPRILLIVDEFQEFFSDDDNLANQTSLLLDRLVRQGRAFGMHIILGSQTLAGTYSLARATIDQMAIRVALQCADADSRMILSDDNGAARLLSRPGEAIYNAENGLFEGNQLFQVAWLSDDERHEYLDQVKRKSEQQKIEPQKPMIVFEGNEPSNIEDNVFLRNLLRSKEKESKYNDVAWLGEPVSISEATAARFRRQNGSNLLIVGQNEQLAVGMLASGTLSLSLQYRSSHDIRFIHLDFTSVDAAWAGEAERIAKLWPEVSTYGRRREVSDYIDGLFEVVNNRLENPDNITGPTYYLVIWGLQRARDLRFDEDSLYGGYSDNWDGEEEQKKEETFKQFSKIIREGPELDVHIITWCDTYGNLNRTLQRQDMNEFDLRVVLQMNSEDSTNLIDTPIGHKLGPNKALLYDEYSGQMEKFRPYRLPSDKWLRRLQDLNIHSNGEQGG